MKFVITIEVYEVAEGDVTELAQAIWDEHAEPFDADAGEFKLSISKARGGSAFAVDWQPVEHA